MTPRHSADEICQNAGPNPNNDAAGTKRLFSPGFPNIVLCHVFCCAVFLAPLALLFAVSYAEHSEERLFGHYYYIRTTIALMVIGSSLGGIMIVLGAEVSTQLILAGLLLVTLTGVLALLRCVKGVVYALKRRSPTSYRSYIL